MALYLISYDIEDVGNSEARSEEIRDAIRDLGGIWILYSQWILRKNGTNSATLCNQLRRSLHPRDHLLVNEITLTKAAWFNIPELDRIKTRN